MEQSDPFHMEPEVLQGAFATILERALKDAQTLPRPALAWCLARDIVAHMARCRYQIALDRRRAAAARPAMPAAQRRQVL
jgi:hypothetical protein